MPAALMIGHHFSISALWKARERLRRLLLARRDLLAEVGEPLPHRRIGERLTTAALSLAITSVGVPFGTQKPYQTDDVEARQAGLVDRRDVGRRGQRVLAVTA